MAPKITLSFSLQNRETARVFKSPQEASDFLDLFHELFSGARLSDLFADAAEFDEDEEPFFGEGGRFAANVENWDWVVRRAGADGEGAVVAAVRPGKRTFYL